MRKCLILVTIFIASLPNIVKAQSHILGPNASDTVCVRQKISLSTPDSNASSFYWGFCSGYMLNTIPDGSNMGGTFGLQSCSSIELVKDGDNYYGFALNWKTTELLKFEYGISLSN